MGEHKIINLDDAAKTVEIKLGGETFNISRITLEMRQLYGEYLEHRGAYMMAVIELQKKAEKEDDLGALEAIEKEVTKNVQEFAITRAKELEEMLRLILEKNNIKYSKKWWESNTDYQGMEDFIIEAIRKDEVGASSKKKEAAS